MEKTLYTKKITIRKDLGYLITIFALNVVNPFFSTVIFSYLLVFLIFLLFVAFSKRIRIVDKKIGLILLCVYFLIALQSLFSGRFSPAAIYYPILSFYIPFLIYRLLGVNFFKYFVNVLFAIAILTTPLWLLQSSIPIFDNFVQNAIDWVHQYNWDSQPRSLLFYTAIWDRLIFNQDFGIGRNSGLFHEPGGYAVFLILGIVINTLINRKLFDKKNIVFMFSTFTTFSTAGFISLFIIMFGFFLTLKMFTPIKVVVVMIFIFVSFSFFEKEGFLNEKLISHYELQTYAAQSSYMGRTVIQRGRFFAAYMALNNIWERPLWGSGIIYATSSAGIGELHQDSSSGYGPLGILATYGIVFGSLFIFYLYKGFKLIYLAPKKSEFFLIVLFISLMLAVSSQAFIRTTIFNLIFIFGLYSTAIKLNKKKIPYLL